MGKCEVKSLVDVPSEFAGERRIWISIRVPPDSDRKLSPEPRAVLDMWTSCLSHDAPIFPLPLAPSFPCDAYADACADARHAGIGGFVTAPSGRTVWFRAHFPLLTFGSRFLGFLPTPHRKNLWLRGSSLAKLHYFGALLS